MKGGQQGEVSRHVMAREGKDPERENARAPARTGEASGDKACQPSARGSPGRKAAAAMSGTASSKPFGFDGDDEGSAEGGESLLVDI